MKTDSLTDAFLDKKEMNPAKLSQSKNQIRSVLPHDISLLY